MMDVIKLHIPTLDPDKISAEDIISIRKERSPALVPIKFIIRLNFSRHPDTSKFEDLDNIYVIYPKLIQITMAMYPAKWFRFI